MKTLVIAAGILFGLSTAALASNLAFVGNAEYAVEAETFETNLGVEVSPLANLTVTPLVTFGGVDFDTFEFTGAEVGVSYNATTVFDIYGTVEVNSDFEYSEVTVGVAFSF